MMAKRFNWKFPRYGVLGAAIVLTPTIIFGNDIGTFLLSVVIAALVVIVLLILAIVNVRRHSLSALAMLVVFCCLSWLLFKAADDIRYTGRWLFESKTYKSAVLAQSADGSQLKHVEWDGWGFAGSDTSVYLVFDPKDSLAAPAKSHNSGKFDGIPCEVPRVRRLEKYWYSVEFYTNTGWDSSGGDSC